MALRLSSVHKEVKPSFKVRYGVNEHFNEEERVYLKFKFNKKMYEKPLSDFEDLERLTKNEKKYAYSLAFYQRVDLGKQVDNAPVSFTHYDCDENKTFITFEETFEHVYAEMKKPEKNDKAYYKKMVKQELFKLWMKGYAIYPNETKYQLGKEQLVEMAQKRGKQTYALFVAFMLLNIKESTIKEMPELKIKKNVFESEREKWDEVEYTEIKNDFEDFIFTFLTERTKDDVYKERGQRITTYEKIKTGTFKNLALAGRELMEILKIEGISQKEQMLEPKEIKKVYLSNQFKKKSDNKKEMIRYFIREYLRWKNPDYDMQLDIENISPKKLKNKKTVYGENIEYLSAIKYIDIITDNTSLYVDEEDLNEFKCKRALYIQLATGARMNEVLLLKKDCLRKINGEWFVHFHKTKNGRPYLAKIDEHTKQIIEELVEVVSDVPIKVNSENSSSTFGDDSVAKRLFPNGEGTNIIVLSNVNRFLRRLAERAGIEKDFSTHDMRRVHAIYLKTKGYSDTEIKEKLNQEDISSQIPYLLTIDNKTLSDLEKVAKKGIYDQESVKKLNKFKQKMDENENLFEEGMKIYEEVVESILNEEKNEKIINEIGNPLITGICTIEVTIDCGHNELICFTCENYTPEQTKAMEHKAVLLRYHVNQLFLKEAKKKEKYEKEEIQRKIDSIQKQIESSCENVFKQYKLNKTEISKLNKELVTKAKNFYNQFKRQMSQKESMELIKNGEGL